MRTIKDKLNKYLLSREVPTISDNQLQVLQMREKYSKEYLLSTEVTTNQVDLAKVIQNYKHPLSSVVQE